MMQVQFSAVDIMARSAITCVDLRELFDELFQDDSCQDGFLVEGRD
jgi:hypothetical protein